MHASAGILPLPSSSSSLDHEQYMDSAQQIDALLLVIYLICPQVDCLLRIFDCDVVDQASDASDLALEAGLVLGQHWRHDYRMSCYRGTHRLLTLLLGVPGLLVFALGCPVATAWWLAVNAEFHEEPVFLAQ